MNDLGSMKPKKGKIRALFLILLAVVLVLLMLNRTYRMYKHQDYRFEKKSLTKELKPSN